MSPPLGDLGNAPLELRCRIRYRTEVGGAGIVLGTIDRVYMNALPAGYFQHRSGRVLGVLILGLGLMGGTVSEVYAQEAPDTLRAPPTGVEPAGLDSLPTGDVEPSFQPSEAPPAAADTGETEQAYVNADSLSALREGGERVQELMGDVFVRQDTTRLRSEYALRYLNRDELLFVGDVVIYERGDTLRADTVRYDRSTEVGRARGHVRLTDGEVTVRAKRGTYYAAEKRSVFPDSVVLVDSNRVLRARHGTYWSDARRAEFGGGVRLKDPGTTIFSDSLTYYRDRDRSIAVGNVFIDRQGGEASADSSTRTYLFGDRVDNREQHRYTRVQGHALLVQLRRDSTGTPTDTLVVRARRLEAFRTDTHRRLVAVDSVEVWQPDLAAVADSAVYDRVVAPTTDSTTTQEVPIDTTRPPSDSISVIAETTSPTPESSPPPQIVPDSLRSDSQGTRKENTAAAGTLSSSIGTEPSASGRGEDESRPDSLRQRGDVPTAGASRQWDTPTAQSEDALPLEEIRLFQSPMTWFEGSQVWGDSIRVHVRNRSPDTIFVRGAAFAAQRDSVLDRIQQLSARTLTAFFRGDSLRRIRARPNARAIRFLAAEDGSLNGAAKTSGDRVVLRFEDGTVKRISVVGGVQSTYYRKPKNIPDPFELDGFKWVPERQPTRAGLLRDERVRRWLDLSLGPPARPVARQRPQSAPGGGLRLESDSTGQKPPIPLPPRQRRPGSDRSPPDSVQGRPRVPPDSLSSSGRPLVPADTSETNRNPRP